MMKPGQSASRRKQILLIYTLVMLIPGIILGYLASRGILNDKALREKQARQELTLISSGFFHHLDSVLNDEILYPDIRSNSDSYVLLEFNKAAGSGFQIGTCNLLYYPQSQAVTRENIDPSINWERGWELEFRTKEYGRAVAFYQDILENSGLPADQLEAYMAMARIRKKQNEPDDASKIYQLISDSFPRSTYKGIPARALALKELGTRMANEELIQELLNPQVPYFKAQYRLLAGDLNGPDSLKSELEKRQAQTDQAIQIYEEADLLFKGSVVNPNKRYYSSELYSLAFISYGSLDGTRKGLVLDLIPFLEKHFHQLFDADRQSETNWAIEDETGKRLWGSESPESTDWLSFSFPDQLPPWKMKLSMVEKSWLSTMLEPGNGVFLLIFIFIILVMGFGLLFTLNILNQEFKLNKLKTEFISNVSHELKSPLTSIRQMTEMLHEHRIDSEEQRNDYYGFLADGRKPQTLPI